MGANTGSLDFFYQIGGGCLGCHPTRQPLVLEIRRLVPADGPFLWTGRTDNGEIPYPAAERQGWAKNSWREVASRCRGTRSNGWGVAGSTSNSPLGKARASSMLSGTEAV